MCDSLPLQLPSMALNNVEIKRENSAKFLGVIIDENLTWKNHIEVVENKISKNTGVLYRASHLLDFKNLLKILLTDYDLLLCPTLICSLFVYLVTRKSILNIDSSDSLVDKLTLFSDLND